MGLIACVIVMSGLVTVSTSAYGAAAESPGEQRVSALTSIARQRVGVLKRVRARKTRIVTMTGINGIPSSATSVEVRVVVKARSRGKVRIWPTGITGPKTTMTVGRRYGTAETYTLTPGVDGKLSFRNLTRRNARILVYVLGYEVPGVQAPASPPPPVQAPPIPPPPIVLSTRIYAAGDIGVCGSLEMRAVGAFLAGRPEPFVALGDMAYPNGTAEDFKDCYDPYFGPFKDRTWPVLGNHDYPPAGESGYFSYFGLRVGTPAAPYYSTDFGNWHFVMLNSNCKDFSTGCGTNSSQYKWLQQDLAAHPGKCLAAVTHHPFYSSAGLEIKDTTALWNLLDEAGADLLLSGHQHNYERFARMGSTGQTKATGIRQFIVGTGGAPLGPFGEPVIGSQVRTSTTWGPLQLDLRADGYSWNFVRVRGSAVTDSGSDSC